MYPGKPSGNGGRLESHFAEVIDLDAESRVIYLDEVGRHEPGLRHELETLLVAYDAHAETVATLFEQLPLARPSKTDSTSDQTLGLVGRQVGPYNVVKKLGEGGMGVVYQAQDTRLGRTVALKFLPLHMVANDEAKTRFKQEAQTASALDHANICTIHDIGETNEGQLFIAMAYYPGETLKYTIRKGPVSVKDTLACAVQVATGLDKAHSAGIIHRDIKPANLLVTSDGVAKILDFGIAKISGVELTRSGARMGTVAYMSPEQMRGDDVDQRTDIWSFGAVLFEMLTGKRPFAGDTDASLVYSVLNTEPDFSAIEDPVLRSVVEACLKKDRDERFATAGDLADALRIVANELGVGALNLPRQRRRTTQLMIGIATLLVAAVTVATWLIFVRTAGDGTGPPDKETLVVLPFDNLGDPEDQYFADGMAEELSTRLASVKSLGIISRNTANKYRGTTKSTPEIGKELGVEYVVGGTVRWVVQADGTRRVRISPYLTRVSDDLQLWANSYDRNLRNVLDVQRDVAVQIVNSLRSNVDPSEIERVGVELTSNADAYQEYLDGLALHREAQLTSRLSRVYSDIILEAIDHFENAVELDSLFAEASYMLSRSLGGLVWQDWYAGRDVPQERIQEATEAAQRVHRTAAGSRADLLAYGYHSLYIQRDYAGALAYFTRAADQFEDTDVIEAISDIHAHLGNIAFAIDYLDKILEVEPNRSDILHRAAGLSQFTRRFDKVREYSDRANAIDSVDMNYCALAMNQLKLDWNTVRARETLANAPDPVEHCHWLDFHDGNFQLLLDHENSGEGIWGFIMVEVYRRLGLKDREVEFWNSVKKDVEIGDVRPYINKYGFLAVAEAGLGNRDEAVAALDSFKVAVGKDRGVTFTNYNTFAAQVYALLGMRDELFYVLNEEAGRPGFISVFWLSMPWFDSVRDDPRFEAVLKKFEAWQRPEDR